MLAELRYVTCTCMENIKKNFQIASERQTESENHFLHYQTFDKFVQTEIGKSVAG